MIVRIFKNLVFITLPSILFCIILLELFFRYIIPASEMPYVYFDQNDQILRYDTNGRTEGIYTIGRFAQQRGRWRMNNYGWNSKIDYLPYRIRHKPLIAIIGDSYVEAFQVNVEDNIAAVLHNLLRDNYDVYSFGMSGAALSQYLQMSRYVNHYFKPEVIVFSIVHNDFDESIKDLINNPIFLQLTYKSGEFLEVPPTPYHPNSIRRISGRSALARYLVINLGIERIIDRLTNKRITSNFNANIYVKEAITNREIINNAMLFLTKKIMEENTDKEIIFMIDAPRKDIYSRTLNNSNVLWMNNILKDACIKNKCHFIDLTKPFAEKFNETNIKFNSDYDFHWNEVGHKTAAQVLYDGLIELGIVFKRN